MRLDGNQMIALIDGDICIYRVGFTTENDDEWIAKARLDEMVEGILADTGATEYQFWLSDKTQNNFRTRYYPEYKANRKDFVLPKHYDALKIYALENWDAQIAIEQEADDALGICQTQWRISNERETIICSIDKDLHQIPGHHFNFVKKEFKDVTYTEGKRHFYFQLLKGDTSDNIQGCPGIGDVKANKILGEESEEVSLFQRVLAGYLGQYRDKIYKTKELSEGQIEFVTKQLLVNGICLKIRQQEEEVWKFPELKQIPELKLSSITPPQVEQLQSTEHI